MEPGFSIKVRGVIDLFSLYWISSIVRRGWRTIRREEVADFEKGETQRFRSAGG